MGKHSLGEFEMLVLLAALRLGAAEASAVGIVDELYERTGRKVQRASVYVTLQRLESKGLVSTQLGPPKAERGGKAKRLVTVEPAGVDAIRAARAAFQNMWTDLDPVLEA